MIPERRPPPREFDDAVDAALLALGDMVRHPDRWLPPIAPERNGKGLLPNRLRHENQDLRAMLLGSPTFPKGLKAWGNAPDAAIESAALLSSMLDEARMDDVYAEQAGGGGKPRSPALSEGADFVQCVEDLFLSAESPSVGLIGTPSPEALAKLEAAANGMLAGAEPWGPTPLSEHLAAALPDWRVSQAGHWLRRYVVCAILLLVRARIEWKGQTKGAPPRTGVLLAALHYGTFFHRAFQDRPVCLAVTGVGRF